MAVVIDWLTSGGNYNQRCSGDKQNDALKEVISQDAIDSVLAIVHD